MNAYIEMLTEGELMEHIARTDERIEQLRRMKAHYEEALLHRQLAGRNADELDIMVTGTCDK